jgi:hypothetical protein
VREAIDLLVREVERGYCFIGSMPRKIIAFWGSAGQREQVS